MNELILLQGDQLDINWSDLDKPTNSICPKCSGKIIKLSIGCGACGWHESEKLLGDILSIPCVIKEPYKELVDGLIIRDRGSELDVQIGDRILPIAKIYVFPQLPSPKKCRTDQTIPPSKKRRSKGENSGSIFTKPVKRGSKTYKQYWFKYEELSNGKRIGKSKYIPKTSLAKVMRMNQEKQSPKAILDFLNSKSRRKKK